MDKRSPFISFIVIFVSFLAIEGVCLALISNNGTIQRYKLMEGVRRVQSIFWRSGSNIKHYFSLKSENQELVADNIRLANENEIYRSIFNNISADTISIHTEIPHFSYIQAKVVRNTTNKQQNYIIIDKGSIDGIKPDMGVITGNGIIGHIHSVGRHYSLVVSLLSTKQNVTALIKKNNTFGPLSWDGRDPERVILSEIPLHTNFSVGDTIVSSGYSAVYPAGIEIGTVESSHLVDGINYDLTIKLLEDYSSLYHVFVIYNSDIEEFSSLVKQGESL